MSLMKLLVILFLAYVIVKIGPTLVSFALAAIIIGVGISLIKRHLK